MGGFHSITPARSGMLGVMYKAIALADLRLNRQLELGWHLNRQIARLLAQRRQANAGCQDDERCAIRPMLEYGNGIRRRITSRPRSG
jgi:hypothetical protein